MAKFYLPTSKDGELFPDVLQTPARTRVTGIDTNTPEGRAALAERAGAINRFVTAQRQRYSLSPVTHHAARGQIPDGWVAYTNQFGNEQIQVHVDVGGKKTLPPDKWPDWAMIDLHVPTISGVIFDGAAYVVSPILAPIVLASEQPIRGVVVDGSEGIPGDGTTRPAIAYPDIAEAFASPAGGNDRISSLLVDLRQFRGISAAVVKLYGYLWTTVGTPVLSGWGRNQTEDSLSSSTTILGTTTFSGGVFTPPMTSFWHHPLPSDSYLHSDFQLDVSVVDTPAPPPTPSSHPTLPSVHEDVTLDPASGLVTRVDAYTLDAVPAGGSNFTVSEQHVIYNWTIFPTFSTSFDVTPRDCEVRAEMFASGLHWAPSKQTYSLQDRFQNHARWEDQAIYPARHAGTKIGAASVGMGAFNDDLGQIVFNHFDMPFLGTVTLDLQHWGISFKPA